MVFTSRVRVLALTSMMVPAIALGTAEIAGAQQPVYCAPAPPVAVTRARPVYPRNPNSTLGTFGPTPYIMVGGDYPTGRGYSPLDIYGDQTLAIYGPMSPLRGATAPVRGYARGYDGRLTVIETNSFSNPNLPSISPIVYPTEANYYYGPRVSRVPRWGSSAINWIDQN